MSEVERHIGKIRKIELNGMMPEEWYQKECEKRGISKPDFYDTWKQCYNRASQNGAHRPTYLYSS